MRHLRFTVTAALALAALPAAASAVTVRTSFQMVQLTPPRAWADTSFIPFTLADPPSRSYRYRIGSRTFAGVWTPASVGVTSASDGLGRLRTEAAGTYGHAVSGAIADRPLTGAERRRFITMADLYREADVLVVAPGHPACSGLRRGQARAIATGRVTRWSQVVTGAAADVIRVRHPVGDFGEPVPHLGTRIVGVGLKAHVDYAPAAVGAPDAGVGAAAGGDASIAAITTWSRVRALGASVCVVPLDGVAPTDASVAALRYPEAFPVTYVVTRRVPGDAEARSYTAVLRRAMRAHLRSERLRAQLRGRGVLVTGDPVAPDA